MSLELDVPDELRDAVAATLEAAGVTDGHLSVELVAEDRIRELNREHRDRDAPTDVLSFPVDGTGETTGPRELGDVVICPAHTADLREAAVHGVLHLCGYDHEADDGRMLALQGEILAGLGITPTMGREPGAGGGDDGEQAANVREATEDDVPELLRCYEWLFAPPGSEPPGWNLAIAAARLAETIASEQSAALVAFEPSGRRLVGFCTLYLDLVSVRYGSRCWLEDLAVDPSRRSEGIGAALLTSARGWAYAAGATHLQLVSDARRTEAHRFYEREEPDGRSLSYVWLTGPGS